MVRLLPDLRIFIVAVVRSLPPLGSMVLLTTLILFVERIAALRAALDDLEHELMHGPRRE